MSFSIDVRGRSQAILYRFSGTQVISGTSELRGPLFVVTACFQPAMIFLKRLDFDINDFLDAVSSSNLHHNGTTEHPLSHRIGEEFHHIVFVEEEHHEKQSRW